MKQIKLTQGKFAIINDEDYEELNEHKWYVLYDKNTDGYRAVRHSKTVNGKRRLVYMSRKIMGAKKGEYVDHRNHNTLDNQKSNLRICTNQQNCMNQLTHKNGTSKYKGVYWDKEKKKWRVLIGVNRKQIHIGYFHDEISAAKYYDKKAREFFGDFAYVNFKDVGI